METVECKSMFSNGTEYEWFLENFCEKCTRLRNEKCRIYKAIEDSRFDASRFPYDDLMDYKDGYAGKVCKSFTTEKQQRKRYYHKGIVNQISLDDWSEF